MAGERKLGGNRKGHLKRGHYSLFCTSSVFSRLENKIGHGEKQRLGVKLIGKGDRLVFCGVAV